MNAFENRQQMRRGRCVPTVSVDVEAERQAHKERVRLRAMAERRESSRVRHLPPSTPVKPWTKESGMTNIVATYLGDLEKAREARARRHADTHV